MSKKIDKTLDELQTALRKHARIAASAPQSTKKAQRAAARVSAAASAYAAAVSAKAGLPNPFDDLVATTLEPTTITSLRAERDELETKRKSRGLEMSEEAS